MGNFTGWSAELGDDFEELCNGLQDELLEQPFLAEANGVRAVCRSPVFTLVDGRVMQPVSIVPAPMLRRFWTDEGREVLEGTELAPLVAKVAMVLVRSDDLARAGLGQVNDIYVTPSAPASPWPLQDARLRIASLILADSVRKLAAGFSDRELIASYGISRSTEHDESARRAADAMKAEEASWIAAALAGGN
jgi:hypothetical protein